MEASAQARHDWLPAMFGGLYALFAAIAGFFLTVYLKQELHFSGAQIGLLYAAQAVCMAIAAIPIGLGNDRLTSRALIVLSLGILAATFVGMIGVRGYLAFLGVFFTWSLANATFRFSLDTQLLKTDLGDRTGHRVGWYQALRFVGMAIGTVATGYLVAWLDFERSFLLVALAMLGLALAALRLPPTPIERVPLTDYWADLRDRKVLFFAAWLFLFTSHWGAETTSYGLFLKEGLQLTIPQMGWYISGEYVAIVVTVLALRGPLSRRNQPLRMIAVLGLLVSGVGLIGGALPPVGLSFAFRVLHGAGDGALFMVQYVGVARLFAIDRLGGNSGFINLAAMSGYVCGALIYGPLGEHYGYQLPFWLSGALTLLLIPLLLVRGEATEPSRHVVP
jgi:MFS family permease